MKRCLSSCLSYRLLLTLLPEKQHLSLPAESVSSCSRMDVIMWCNSGQKACFVVVTVSGTCTEKKKNTGCQPSWPRLPSGNSIPPCHWEPDRVCCLLMATKCNVVTLQNAWWVRISITTHQRDSSGFFKWGDIKYISIVRLFPTVITDQQSLSLEKQRAASAQTLSFVLQLTESSIPTHYLQVAKYSARPSCANA